MVCPRIVAVVVGALIIAGCVSVRDSEQFYHPITLQTYPPRPDNYPIPILAGPPKEKFEVIGRMSFSGGRGNQFMMDCLVYNARRVGADAVILASASTTAHPYSYNLPGYTAQQPVTTYTQATRMYYGSGGYAGYGTASGTSTSYVPVYHPGYSGVGTAFRTSVDAFMIRLK